MNCKWNVTFRKADITVRRGKAGPGVVLSVATATGPGQNRWEPIMEVLVRTIPISALLLLGAVLVPRCGALAQSAVRRVTMAEAIEAFGSGSLALRIARAEADEAVGLARQYRSYANPAFSLVHEALGSSEDNYWETIAGVSQQVEWPRRTASRSRVAAHTADVAGARFRADSLRLAFEVRRAWVTAWLAEKTEETRREAAEVMRTVAEAADRRLEAGDISLYEARRLGLELVRAEREVSESELETRTARRTLAVLIAPGVGVHEVGPAAEVSGLPPMITYQAALAALDGRPDLEAAASDLDAAKARSRVALDTWVPDPTLSLGYKNQRDGFSGAALSVGLPMPVFDWGAGTRQGAVAREGAAAHGFVLTRRLAEIDLMGVSDRFTTRRAHLESTGDELLAQADFVLRTARIAHGEGRMSQVELLDAAATYRDTRIDALSLRAATWIAYYDLLRAMARAPGEES